MELPGELLWRRCIPDLTLLENIGRAYVLGLAAGGSLLFPPSRKTEEDPAQ
jgi:hypothetical protein